MKLQVPLNQDVESQSGMDSFKLQTCPRLASFPGSQLIWTDRKPSWFLSLRHLTQSRQKEGWAGLDPHLPTPSSKPRHLDSSVALGTRKLTSHSLQAGAARQPRARFSRLPLLVWGFAQTRSPSQAGSNSIPAAAWD